MRSKLPSPIGPSFASHHSQSPKGFARPEEAKYSLKFRRSALRRREQIISAAEICFRRSGFHSTSVAQIAAEGKIAVGLIYRYFVSKDDIIVAVVDRLNAHQSQDLAVLERSKKEPFAALLVYLRSVAHRRGAGEEAALFLEAMAEAARNANVAERVMTARQERLNRISNFMRNSAPGCWTPEILAQKVKYLISACDALALHEILGHEVHVQDAFDHLSTYLDWLFERPSS